MSWEADITEDIPSECRQCYCDLDALMRTYDYSGSVTCDVTGPCQCDWFDDDDEFVTKTTYCFLPYDLIN